MTPSWSEARSATCASRPREGGSGRYRDYLGSNLEILDVASGNATIMHQYRGSFQAPNWTRDGKALIYSQEGRLYRFDLSSRSAEVINTGFATRNNNDHVLSFDGRMLAISNHAVEDAALRSSTRCRQQAARRSA